MIPDNIDDAFALFQKHAAEVDAAIAATEKEQEAGRSGYDSYVRAQSLADNLNEFGRLLGQRIEEARRSL